MENAQPVEEEKQMDRSGLGARRGGPPGKEPSGGGGGSTLGLIALALAMVAVGASGFAYIRAQQSLEQTLEENAKLTQQVQDLGDDVAIVNQISEESLGALRRSMQNALTQAEEKLAQIDSEGIVANTNAINQIAGAVRTARSEAAQVRDALPVLEKRIAEVLTSANKGIQGVQGELGKRTNTINKSIKDVSASVDKRISTIGKAVGGIKVTAAKAQTRVGDAEKAVGGLRRQIDKLGRRLTNFDTGAVDRLGARMGGLEQELGALPLRLNSLEQNLAQIQGRLARIGQ